MANLNSWFSYPHFPKAGMVSDAILGVCSTGDLESKTSCVLGKHCTHSLDYTLSWLLTNSQHNLIVIYLNIICNIIVVSVAFIVYSCFLVSFPFAVTLLTEATEGGKGLFYLVHGSRFW